MIYEDYTYIIIELYVQYYLYTYVIYKQYKNIKIDIYNFMAIKGTN